MTLRCPNCHKEIDVKQIVALESWHDDDREIVRDVILACPSCAKPLAPAATKSSENRSLTS